MAGTRYRTQIATAAMAAAVVMLLAAPAPAAGKIAVREESEVVGRVVLIGDVAQITGFSEEELHSIEALKFTTSPQPNMAVSFTRDQIKGKLLNAGLDLANFDVAIPDKITIRRKAVIVSGKRIVDEGLAFLRSALPWESLTVEPDESKTLRDVVLPYGEASLEYELDTVSKKYGAHNFHVKILLDGEPVRMLGLTSYVKVTGDVVAAARSIKAGHIITEEDLVVERRDVTGLRPGAYNSPEELLGKQTLRNISEGDILTHSSIETAPDINTGDMVTLLYRKPGFEITARAKALQKGYIGENIKVVTTEPKKVLTGIVVDSQTVEIVEP